MMSYDVRILSGDERFARSPIFPKGPHEPSNTISNSNPTAILTHPSWLLPPHDALQLPISIRLLRPTLQHLPNKLLKVNRVEIRIQLSGIQIPQILRIHRAIILPHKLTVAITLYCNCGIEPRLSRRRGFGFRGLELRNHLFGGNLWIVSDVARDDGLRRE